MLPHVSNLEGRWRLLSPHVPDEKTEASEVLQGGHICHPNTDARHLTPWILNQSVGTQVSCSASLEVCRAERENLGSAVTLDQSFPLHLSGCHTLPSSLSSFLEVEGD